VWIYTGDVTGSRAEREAAAAAARIGQRGARPPARSARPARGRDAAPAAETTAAAPAEATVAEPVAAAPAPDQTTTEA
jgi:small subunit ribosomal protein S3